MLGGLVSSRYAGLACPEWPTCNGGAWFPSWRGAVGLHLLHRSNGYLLRRAALRRGVDAAPATRASAAALRLAAALGLAQVGGRRSRTCGSASRSRSRRLHSALAARSC